MITLGIKHGLNRGLMWGQLVTGLEACRKQLELAKRGDHLLTVDDRDLLRKASDIIAGIEQRAWEAQVAEADAADRVQRKRRTKKSHKSGKKH